ncbi:Cof-type HAD-IIB family hydrolase [Lapidilactobacillus wuchangensis]|uniref:Cof-type HAD-IIB family hydrolase n=1 Tax=Lapidilactobacillus wuchangensis TaxID=2486001 RepID=UPI000F775E8C|nr:Cof-type HAD-IIB family hydrolase [Lapidilactobacillus wuchangensis]
MTRKLIAFDLDGTLLDDQKHPLPNTLTALRLLEQQGHLVTIATGRTLLYIEDILAETQLKNYIVCNGAAAFVDDQQIVKENLNPQVLDHLINRARALKIDLAVLTLHEIKRLTNFAPKKMATAMTSFGKSLPDFEAHFAEQHDIYQALAFFDASMDATFTAEFPAFKFVRWHPYCVDVIPRDGSKAETIMAVAKHAGIAPADTIAFGDALNDLEMIQDVGVGVAMGNASPQIKQVANLVTADNEHDGIYQALQQLQLI